MAVRRSNEDARDKNNNSIAEDQRTRNEFSASFVNSAVRKRNDMMTKRKIGAVLVAVSVSGAGEASAQVEYGRAERLIGWNLAPLVLGEASAPAWVGTTDRFWYRVRTSNGIEFVLVDPVANVRRPLFDNARLASAMSV
jgi:hypothetical protein